MSYEDNEEDFTREDTINCDKTSKFKFSDLVPKDFIISEKQADTLYNWGLSSDNRYSHSKRTNDHYSDIEFKKDVSIGKENGYEIVLNKDGKFMAKKGNEELRVVPLLQPVIRDDQPVFTKMWWGKDAPTDIIESKRCCGFPISEDPYDVKEKKCIVKGGRNKKTMKNKKRNYKDSRKY